MAKENLKPSATHLQAASSILGSVNTRILQRFPDNSWDFAVGLQFIYRFINFIRSIRDDLGDHPFGFELCQDSSGAKMVTTRQIIEANSTRPTIIGLDCDLKVIRSFQLECSDPRHPNEADFSFSASDKVIAFYESRRLLRFYAFGYTAGTIGLDDPDSPPGQITRYSRNADNYELSLRDHFRIYVRHWTGTGHWDDRKTRRLFAKFGPYKTEAIFHNSLLAWLEAHIAGDVKSKAKDKNNDEPDIHITSVDGHKYIIEIKWLGSNGSTNHDKKQLTKGINQLSQYLKKNGGFKKGTLAVYDGREKADFDAITFDEILEDGCISVSEHEGVGIAARGSCIVMFLESKTASEQE